MGTFVVWCEIADLLDLSIKMLFPYIQQYAHKQFGRRLLNSF